MLPTNKNYKKRASRTRGMVNKSFGKEMGSRVSVISKKVHLFIIVPPEEKGSFL